MMRKSINILTVIFAAFFLFGNISAQEENIPVFDTGFDSIQWVSVPAGEFFYGQHNHVTNIDYDYEIMVTEVTNASYAQFLNEALAAGKIKFADNKVTGYYPGEPFDGHKHEFEITAGDKVYMDLTAPGTHIKHDGQKFIADKMYANHPVTMVTWFGANAYAQFYGWRLPLEVEWEKAARSTDKRCYPWGDELAHGNANYYGSHDPMEEASELHSVTTPVGFFNGKTYDGFKTIDSPSPYGAYDMAGNVWEWTGDDYPDQHYRYLRGGSIDTYENDLRVWPHNSAGPSYSGIDIGFRCVRDVKKENSEAAK